MTWPAGIDAGGTNLQAVAVAADVAGLQRLCRASEDRATGATRNSFPP